MADADFSIIWKSLMSSHKRRLTWEAKRDKNESEKYFSEQARSHRIKKLRMARRDASIASGLVSYREALGLSRTQFADMFGITRRALFNYESGGRSISSNLLEAIAKRGDVELNEIFAIPPDPIPLDQRRKEARLAIDLLFACFRAFPGLDINETRAEAIYAATIWPQTRRISEKSIKKEAERVMDELAERYRQEEEWKQVNAPPNKSDE